MKTQLYRLRMSQENFENARPGQYVHENDEDEDEYVRGFISAIDVDRFEMELCLFEQADLPPGGRCVRESMTMDECSSLLAIALDQNPEAKLAWADLIKDHYDN